MNFIKTLAVLVTAVTLVLYAVGSFAAWHYSPGEWGDVGRAVISALWLAGVLASFGVASEMTRAEDD